MLLKRAVSEGEGGGGGQKNNPYPLSSLNHSFTSSYQSGTEIYKIG